MIDLVSLGATRYGVLRMLFITLHLAFYLVCKAQYLWPAMPAMRIFQVVTTVSPAMSIFQVAHTM